MEIEKLLLQSLYHNVLTFFHLSQLLTLILQHFQLLLFRIHLNYQLPQSLVDFEICQLPFEVCMTTQNTLQTCLQLSETFVDFLQFKSQKDDSFIFFLQLLLELSNPIAPHTVFDTMFIELSLQTSKITTHSFQFLTLEFGDLRVFVEEKSFFLADALFAYLSLISVNFIVGWRKF